MNLLVSIGFFILAGISIGVPLGFWISDRGDADTALWKKAWRKAAEEIFYYHATGDWTGLLEKVVFRVGEEEAARIRALVEEQARRHRGAR